MSKEEKILKKKEKKEKRKQIKSGFKKFIFRGNVIDLAVAVAVGSAFTAIVNSFVKDIIGGVMGWLMGDVNLEDLKIYLGEKSLYKTLIFTTYFYYLYIKSCVSPAPKRLHIAVLPSPKKEKGRMCPALVLASSFVSLLL